jgi:hypothetical protein
MAALQSLHQEFVGAQLQRQQLQIAKQPMELRQGHLVVPLLG